MKKDDSLATLIDAQSVIKWLGDYQIALALVGTPAEAKRALTRIDLATEYVRQLKLGVTVEMEVVEAAVFTEFVLGQTLDAAKRAGELHAGGDRRSIITNKDNAFSLKAAGITLNESSHAQRYVEYVERFDLDSLRDLVREKKLSRTLSRSGVYKDIDQALRRIEHEEKEQPSGPVVGPFDLIIADPPWKHDAPGATTGSRVIANQYSTASLPEIKSHKPDAADESVLFLWAVAPLLPEALEVIQAWGFLYRTCAIWDKQVIGMGFWFRGQHELLLVGIRGGFPPPTDFLRVSSIFSEKRVGHSQKPECVFQWIEKAWPDARKLEMYARRVRPGWSMWGK